MNDLKETVTVRILDLQKQQETILNRIKRQTTTVNQIIKYGKDLSDLNIKIEELNLMLWQ